MRNVIIPATNETPVGLKISRKVILKLSTMAFHYHNIAGWKCESVHSSPALARQQGFPYATGQFVMVLGYISSMLAEFFGESWVKGGWLDVTMVDMVFENDLLIWEGVVKEKIDEGCATKFVLHVWCRNQFGATVIVGNAGDIIRR